MTKESPLYRLIVTDVDGTIVDSRKEIPAFTRHELQRVTRDYGLDFVLASTRMPISLKKIQEDLALTCSIIAYNGALVMHSTNPELGYSDPLDDAMAAGLINELLAHPVHIGVFSYDKWFVSDLDYWALREVRGTRVWPHPLSLKAAFDKGAIFPVHKVMLRGDPDTLSRLLISLEASLVGLSIGRDQDTIVELTRCSASKAFGLSYLLDAAGIPPSTVLAFGNGYSDISMLKLAGTGIAVHNAPENVRSAADATTLSNDEDGVGFALRKYFPTDDGWLCAVP